MLSNLVPPEWLDFLDAWDEWLDRMDKTAGTPEWYDVLADRPTPPDSSLDYSQIDR